MPAVRPVDRYPYAVESFLLTWKSVMQQRKISIRWLMGIVPTDR